MESFSGDFGFILKSSGKTFSFSLWQYLASEDFVDRLGLLKCCKDFQNFRNVQIILLVNKLEPDWFEWRPLRLKCLPVMFLLSRISIFKFIRWLVNCLTAVSATLPLSGLSFGVEIVISASGNFTWMKDFNWSNLFKISLGVKLIASLVPAWTIKYFGCFRMTGSAWCRKSSTVAPGNFITLTDQSFDKFLCITPFKIESPIKTQVFGG